MVFEGPGGPLRVASTGPSMFLVGPSEATTPAVPIALYLLASDGASAFPAGACARGRAGGSRMSGRPRSTA